MRDEKLTPPLNPSGICQCGCGEPAPLAKQTTRKLRYVRGEPIRFIRGHYAKSVREAIPPPNPNGRCLCGCGQVTPIAKRNVKAAGWAKGHHVAFIKGHNGRGTGARVPGDKYQIPTGYWRVYAPDHPGAIRSGEVPEHRLIAERALGKPLPHGAEIHHVNSDPSDNRPSNLVICQDSAYHKLLHVRTRAYKACGNATWRSCSFCGKYDDPGALFVPASTGSPYHRACRNRYRRERRAAGKNA